MMKRQREAKEAGQQLRRLRHRKKYSIGEMADALGVTWITVWRKEMGQTRISQLFADAVKRLPTSTRKRAA